MKSLFDFHRASRGGCLGLMLKENAKEEGKGKRTRSTPTDGVPSSPARIRRDQNPCLGAAANAVLGCKTWQSSNQCSCAPCGHAVAIYDNSAPPRSPALRPRARKSRSGEIRAGPGQTRPHRECLAESRDLDRKSTRLNSSHT